MKVYKSFQTLYDIAFYHLRNIKVGEKLNGR